MSWYELLLTLHVVAVALWFGSTVAITVVSYRLLAVEPATFGPAFRQMGWWAGKAHPAAGVVILLAGIAMVIEADLSFGELWIVLALVGWVALSGIGGGVISRSGERLEAALDRGEDGEARAHASRLLLGTRIEAALIVLVIVDMVAKPTL